MVARFAKEGKHTSSIIRPFIYEGKANTPLQYYIQTLISKASSSSLSCNFMSWMQHLKRWNNFHP
jgi:hypothetical protein